MGYIVNSEGEKIKVNNPNGYCAENVVLVNDGAILKTEYNLCIYSKECNLNDVNSELVAEVLFDEPPTDEEIIFHMVKNGVNRGTGYSTVEKVKVLDFK